jgi:ADP-ribose pyrophosphatase YjhB (NUDIX family)
MYVIYINDRPLTLLSSAELRTCDPAHLSDDVATHLTANYSGKPRTLLHYADMLEKGSPKVRSVTIVATDLEQLWADFRSKYKWIPAAGGVVRLLGTDQTLFIFRRAYWDLPKGKIDEGEDAPTAALREVQEETGVKELRLGRALPTSYHTYRDRKGKRVLKPTYWFAMETANDQLLPEAEEGIELAEWHTVATVMAKPASIYSNLRYLLSKV